jgi:energy-coupling factor transporter ATP-binding protein EcfA2
MLLKTLFIRFYRSFNFDYLKKHSQFDNKQSHRPWETIDLNGESAWYPYIEIPIFQTITTVVGANESGKSHLLDAIEKGLIRSDDIHRKDFCRYSQFFAVEQGEIRYPDFGYELVVPDNDEQERLKKILRLNNNSQVNPKLDRVYLFRENKNQLTLYLTDTDTNFSPYPLTGDQSKQLLSILPKPFRINPKIAIPNSVSVVKLLEFASLEIPRGMGTIFAAIERDDRVALAQALNQLAEAKSAEIEKKDANQEGSSEIVHGIYNNYLSPKSPGTRSDKKVKEQRHSEAELAYKLICEVANISPTVLGELAEAMLGNDEGFTRGIIERINRALAENLNFPRWWVQDQNFQLVVSARDYDLGFAIRDRTGTEYSFAERSSGLKYFLSYYIQYKAHQARSEASELLLMDEPDQYLSSQAQQNLLQIFQSFADPEDDRKPIQVIYVTHSPFLLDKNYPSRVCVLEKGVEDEGTRVVNDACKNHYEPLRSAFGAFVGQVAFVGNCNLILESNAHQILLANVAQYLTLLPGISSEETLDLNRFTIISAEKSENINDLLYFLRGQDIERPLTLAVVSHSAKVDTDLLDSQFLLQISSLKNIKLSSGLKLIRDLEDLLPLSLVVAAIENYSDSLPNLDWDYADIKDLIERELSQEKSQFDAVHSAFNITRLRFARCVADTLVSWSEKYQEDNQLLVTNFKMFFLSVNDLEHKAVVAKNSSNLLDRVKRQVNTFLQDHPTTAKRSEVRRLLQGLESTVPDPTTLEGRAIHHRIASIKQDFELEVSLMRRIDNFERLRERLEELKNAALLDIQTPMAAIRLENWQPTRDPQEPVSPLDDIRRSIQAEESQNG